VPTVHPQGCGAPRLKSTACKQSTRESGTGRPASLRTAAPLASAGVLKISSVGGTEPPGYTAPISTHVNPISPFFPASILEMRVFNDSIPAMLTHRRLKRLKAFEDLRKFRIPENRV